VGIFRDLLKCVVMSVTLYSYPTLPPKRNRILCRRANESLHAVIVFDIEDVKSLLERVRRSEAGRHALKTVADFRSVSQLQYTDRFRLGVVDAGVDDYWLRFYLGFTTADFSALHRYSPDFKDFLELELASSLSFPSIMSRSYFAFASKEQSQ